jgi:hypothetical protein
MPFGSTYTAYPRSGGAGTGVEPKALRGRGDDDRDGADGVGPHPSAQVGEGPDEDLVPAAVGEPVPPLGGETEGHAEGMGEDFTALGPGEEDLLGEFGGDTPVVGVADRAERSLTRQSAWKRAGASVGLPPVGSFWPGQVSSTFSMADFSAAVTHSPYFFFTATCPAT